MLRMLTFFFILVLAVQAQEAKVSMDFQGVDLNIFLQWFGNLTNKKIIYSGSRGFGQKKIYLIAPEPIPESSVEKICMSLLESNGVTLVKVGKGDSEVYKLVETSNASSKPIAIYSKKELERIESGDYYVSQLVMIKHLKANNVINSLRQAKLLDPRAGSIVEIRGANAIIINDFAPNIKRILKIIDMIDKAPPKTELVFINLKFARANEISQKLQQLFQYRSRERAEYNIPGVNLTIIPDDRTNSLTIRGTSEDIKEVRKLIKRFDQEIKESEVVVKIYSLKHVTPEKILPTLKEFINTPIFKQKTKSGRTNESQISIISNDYTKNLIITASLKFHKELQKVIKKLDIRRPQVLLEAIICEFTPSDSLTLGIELSGLDNIGKADSGTHVHGLSTFGFSSIVDEAGDAISGEKPSLPAGKTLAPGTGLTAFLTKDSKTNIPIILKAIQTMTNAEVLSTPRILTDDGEQAEIRVENEVPVTSTNALNTSTTTTSFKEFVSAGTVLKIKPQIIHKDWLRLEIEQNIEAFVGIPPSAGVPPPKSTRSIKTIVTVPNGKTVILGGLSDRREVVSIDKIPFLGDLPLIGLLFQSKTHSVSKTNLYIFITPKILNDPNFKDLEKISNKEKKKVQKNQKVPMWERKK